MNTTFGTLGHLARSPWYNVTHISSSNTGTYSKTACFICPGINGVKRQDNMCYQRIILNLTPDIQQPVSLVLQIRINYIPSLRRTDHTISWLLIRREAMVCNELWSATLSADRVERISDWPGGRSLLIFCDSHLPSEWFEEYGNIFFQTSRDLATEKKSQRSKNLK